MNSRVDPRDLIGGVVLIGIGLAAVLIGGDYPFGSARRMGPGYFPVVLGWICAALGVAIIAKGCIPKLWDEGKLQAPAWRGLLGVSAAIMAFVLLGDRLGLVPATLLLVGIGAVMDRNNGWRAVLLLSLGVTIGGVALFVYGLGVIFPLFGR
ncbi:tripartite tricarboxylate transporter TctB family protein [Teichococcus cervicalis]|uniref:DUF1468 domain-containing protein n=1 Tax=Pseudoroseomonas cervicalis ATCC 49957 TaxID=525371 RepID=D5RJD8_9PROT|nr:tripartite tricarboxylate transporter TctB family protein [Pseudoroseomonas cervicalis]EFH12581.1 hypothetical protein HMPREF0731_1198 [Pseudoroseomonas cervicalis ATCC 49957]